MFESRSTGNPVVPIKALTVVFTPQHALVVPTSKACGVYDSLSLGRPCPDRALSSRKASIGSFPW